ncbi:MAG: all-trans-retinol 13,14-reductase [Kiritimatiellia bacterium]|jgi:all-trans-retinol 13,14-reductase
MQDVDVVVIGSGAGGLAAATALARHGKSVLVLEQHYLPGGWCHSFPLEGFQFSPGVHYIGGIEPGGKVREIYEGLGVSDHLTMLELNPDGFDHVIVGDQRFDIPKGRENYRERLKQRFPKEQRGIDRFIDDIGQIHRELMAGLNVQDLTQIGRLATSRVVRKGWRRLGPYVDSIVDDPFLKAVLTIQTGDSGLPPSRCPLALHAAIVGHYFQGGYYPKGGARSLPAAFLKVLRAHGGKIKLRTRVERILVEDGKAIGVRLADGTEVRAGLVISNADPAVTWGMVPDEVVPKRVQRRLAKQRWSLSGVSLFFAVDKDLRADGMDSGNYWYARTDVESMYKPVGMSDLSGLGRLPGSFLTVTSLKDPSKRKDGLHTLESFAFVGYDAFRKWEQSDHEDRPEDYAAFKDRMADQMLDVIDEYAPGLRDHVVFKAIGTPQTNRFYVNSTEGNLYGTEKTLRNVGPLAWRIQTPIEGLLMCGASTVGHGVAGATISGVLAAGKALGLGWKQTLNGHGKPLQTLLCDHPETWPESSRPEVAAK